MSTAENSGSASSTGAKGKTSAGTPNKYAEARLAKKKQRRKAHRKTIARSNTNG